MSETLPVDPLLLGIDIGTQAVKALIVRLDGRIEGQASVERVPGYPHPGWVQMNTEPDLWGVVLQVVRKLFAKSGPSAQAVQVIGVSGLVPCLCAIDDAGKAVGSTILYSDNRALEELEWVNQKTSLHQSNTIISARCSPRTTMSFTA
jgi:xylulokinase